MKLSIQKTAQQVNACSQAHCTWSSACSSSGRSESSSCCGELQDSTVSTFKLQDTLVCRPLLRASSISLACKTSKCFNIALSAMCHVFPMQNLVNSLQNQDCYSALIHPRFSLWAHELANQMTIELFRSPCLSPSVPFPISRKKAKGGVVLGALPLLYKHICTGMSSRIGHSQS